MAAGPDVCARSASERASCFRFSVIAVVIPNPLAPFANVGEGSAFRFSPMLRPRTVAGAFALGFSVIAVVIPNPLAPFANVGEGSAFRFSPM
jgi:hypothetical protein